MRILYGVVGEGMGHATRSKVVLEHLRGLGHKVKIVVSGRAFAFLRKHFDDVVEIRGLTIHYQDGAMARDISVLKNLLVAPGLFLTNAKAYLEQVAAFDPHLCISDFDSFSHVFGRLFGRPVISLDHQHVIDRCAHPLRIRDRLPRDFALTKAFVRAKMPGCAHYVVTSFYRPPPKRECTTIVGPILRPEVMALAPTSGDHVLVYQTAVATAELIAALRAIPEQRFVVYARNLGEADRVENVTIRAFDEQRFLEDLASARAVITNGGYTLMSEALYLGKPILSMPLRHQGEQELNAAYLDELGLGFAMPGLDVERIRRFVTAQLSTTRLPAGNARAFDTIDRLLEEVA